MVGVVPPGIVPLLLGLEGRTFMLLVAQWPFDLLNDARLWLLMIGLVVTVLAIVFIFIFLSFLKIWVQCVLTRADISIWNLIWMKLRKVDYEMIVREKIALVQAGVKISTADLEAHFLSGGNVPRTALAVI